MSKRQAAMDQVLDKFARLADSGEEDGDDWTCGRCGRNRSDGVRNYTQRTHPTPGKTTYIGVLICPCCSGAQCPHRSGAGSASSDALSMEAGADEKGMGSSRPRSRQVTELVAGR